MVTIRRAEIKDIPDIMSFFDKHYWKKDHILAKDRAFFEWQFVEDDKVNVFIGIDEESREVFGTLGVIMCNHSEHPDISGCMWKTIRSEVPLLGMELINCAYKTLGVRHSSSLGLTAKAKKMYNLYGYKSLSMDHYYRLNQEIDFKIAVVNNPDQPVAVDTGYSLVRLSSVEGMKECISEEKLRNHLLSKDYQYIQRRYFEHPVYDYHVYAIKDKNGLSDSVLITREVVANGAKACKIVDFYGEVSRLGQITAALDKLVKECGYEYIDIYSYGVPVSVYEEAGLKKCDDSCENIIPNYFHPFVQENIRIDLVDPKLPGLRMFRGDGDQDRPG